MPLSSKWLRPLTRKGARCDESAAGSGHAVSLPGVPGAWLEARQLAYDAGALHCERPCPCHIEATVPRL
jgi:hypothetical protein